MVRENIVSLLDYVIIIRYILFLYAFMNNSILNSVCLPACTSAFVSLPTLSNHTTPPMKPSRSAGPQGCKAQKLFLHWSTILSGAMPQIRVALLPLVGLSCVGWLTLSLMPSIFNIDCCVRTSDLHGLSPFSRTQMAEKNGKGVPSTHLFHHLCTTVLRRGMFFPWSKKILSSLWIYLPHNIFSNNLSKAASLLYVCVCRLLVMHLYVTLRTLFRNTALKVCLYFESLPAVSDTPFLKDVKNKVATHQFL